MVVKMVKMLLQFLTHFQPCNLRYSTREISWNHVYPITPLGPICGSCSSHSCNRRRLGQLQTTDKHNDTIVLNPRVWLEGKTEVSVILNWTESQNSNHKVLWGEFNTVTTCVWGGHTKQQQCLLLSQTGNGTHMTEHMTQLWSLRVILKYVGNEVNSGGAEGWGRGVINELQRSSSQFAHTEPWGMNKYPSAFINCMYLLKTYI